MKTYVYLVIAMLLGVVFTSCKESDDFDYDRISLSVGASLELVEGDVVSIDVSKGSGKFEVTTDCTKISAALDNGKIHIRALEEGKACCYIFDILTREERQLNVYVTPLSTVAR